jgi:F0F1-type ATP synthase membrane subunit b/b'
MVLQVVLAALLSVGVLLKVFWRKIRGWFNPNKTSVSDEIDPTEIAEAESAQPSPEDDLK